MFMRFARASLSQQFLAVDQHLPCSCNKKMWMRLDRENFNPLFDENYNDTIIFPVIHLLHLQQQNISVISRGYEVQRRSISCFSPR